MVSDEEAKKFNKTLEQLKKEADEENEYNGGKAYKEFLKFFYKAKQDEKK